MQIQPYSTTKIQMQLDLIETQLHALKDKVSSSVQAHTSYTYILFASLGKPDARADVCISGHHHFDTAVANLLKRIDTHSKKNNVIFPWVKINAVSQVKPLAFHMLEKKTAVSKVSSFPYGISFEQDFRLAFLNQEINGNRFLQETKSTGLMTWNEEAVNTYLLKRAWNRPLNPFKLSDYKEQTVYLFDTISVFIGTNAVIPLQHGSHKNGIRTVRHLANHIDKLIECGTNHLKNRVLSTGKFDYGVYAASADSISAYNVMRHADAIHALADGYRWKTLLQQEDATLLQKIKAALDYLLTFQVEKDNQSTLIQRDSKNQLFSLGATAAAIIAIADYESLTGDNRYRAVAQRLANGILALQNKSGSFLNITAKQHQAGYDAKAVYALLRLFQLDNQPLWLERSKLAFEHFVNRRAQPAPNHWLSYAVYEMTGIIPDRRYFKMKLDSIEKRIAAMKGNTLPSPTHLHILVCARMLIDRMHHNQLGHLLRGFDLRRLEETIHSRADQQRNGYFYPEIAMFMEKPGLVVGSFFNRQQQFRVRIDDLQQHISAYCLYASYYLSEEPEQSLIPS
ncbi:hypothetical protein [Terribacillus sp. DMT04]|uniref:hypothetical protein n=1 Tax=Terribacillus sp. DMT04 TaxID=2850441 RepID=UPI001C2BD47D|nr:hypothetical protein [Terribacillus sp. DMT04]QXE01419.1 hypothetical protein KS242_15775 [Terribacillus sp. DMT04]